MKILIDINHPAHVHFFKNLYWKLNANNHSIVVVASKKDVAFSLLKEYNIPFINIGSYGKGLLSKFIKLFLLDVKMFFILLKHRPDYVLGISTIRGSHAAKFFKKTKAYVFTDTEHAKEQILLYKNIADKIFTPTCFHENLGKHQVKYTGYQELAYLHPNYFTPNKKVLEKYGVSESAAFFILRFVSWDATHDVGQLGLSDDTKLKLIDMLTKHGKVFITAEENLPKKFEKYKIKVSPGKIHHLMYYSKMYIGEGGTMASEAALLGVPSLYTSTLAMGYINELEQKYKLLKRCTNQNGVLDTVKDWLNTKTLEEKWKIKQKKMLRDKIDVTAFMYEQVSR